MKGSQPAFLRASSVGLALVFSLALSLLAGQSAFGQSVPLPPPIVVVVVDNDNDSNDNGGNDNDGGGRREVRAELPSTTGVAYTLPSAAVIPAAPPPPVVEAETPVVIPAAPPPPPVVLPQVAVPRTGDGSTVGLASGGQQTGLVVTGPGVGGYSGVTVEAVIPAGFPRTGGDIPLSSAE